MAVVCSQLAYLSLKTKDNKNSSLNYTLYLAYLICTKFKCKTNFTGYFLSLSSWNIFSVSDSCIPHQAKNKSCVFGC